METGQSAVRLHGHLWTKGQQPWSRLPPLERMDEEKELLRKNKNVLEKGKFFKKKRRGRFKLHYISRTHGFDLIIYLIFFFYELTFTSLTLFRQKTQDFYSFSTAGIPNTHRFFLDFFKTFSIKGRIWRSFVILFSLSCLCHNNTPSNCIFWRIEKCFLIQTHSIAIIEVSAHKIEM